MKCEGFEELEKFGFISEYVSIDHKTKTMRPTFTLEHVLNCGFLPKGAKVKFRDQGGWPYDRQFATEKGIKKDDILTIKSASIGLSSSTYEFEEVDGKFNTVMFEKVVQ